MGSKIDY